MEGKGKVQDRAHTFGYWLRRRRKALDLTQEALAERVNCSDFTIRKIEADERRPSRPLADRLAVALAVPEPERRAFLETARAARAPQRLSIAQAPLGDAAHTDAPARIPDPAVGAGNESGPFVGREVEFGLLVGLISRLTTGKGQAVLIEGEPGIGKSRLLHEVAGYAQTLGLPTLAANCYEIDRAVPYQSVIDLVTLALERAPSEALGTMAQVSLAELAALAPSVAERFAGLPQLSRDFPEARQARLSRAVGQLLEAAGDGRPLILMVDNVQWADDASAQVLHYLARHVAARPALVIYAYRDEDLASDERLARWVESLRREADARWMRLARLAPADARRLIAALGDARLAAPGLAERLHRETEGNPFFLTSILQSLMEGEIALPTPSGVEPTMLPDALRAAVRARFAHLPQEVRPTLEAAAVLGRHFDFDTLLDVTREPEGRLLDALEALVKRHLLREESEGGVYDFSHDKLREVVYGDIGGTRRRLLHKAVAEALERRGESQAHERDARLAEHYERAQVWDKALEHLVLAAERAQALFAMRDALHGLDRALALAESHPRALDAGQRLALYERRGAARAQAGQIQGAVEDIRRVIDAARAGNQREKARDALIQLGMAYRRADAYDDASACLSEALAQSRAMDDEHHAADTLYHLGTVAWSTGRNDQAIGFHQQAVEICERTGLADLVAVQAYHGRGEAHFADAQPAAAIACYTRSLELARDIGDKSYECENLMMIGHASLGSKGLGDYPGAKTHLQAALDIARAADLQWHIGPTLLGLDHAQACTGHYGQAWTGMTKTLNWLEQMHLVRYQLIAHDYLSQLLLDLGLNEQALEQAERGLALGREAGIDYWRATIEAQRAIARSRLGQPDDAPALRAAFERASRCSEHYLALRCLDAMAEVALAAGHTQGCRAHADELLALAVPRGLREVEASARRWRALAWLADQSYDQAQAELLRAAALAQDIGCVRLQMDVQAALARLFRAQRQGDAGALHEARMRELAQGIEKSLALSGLEARLLHSVKP